MSVWDWVNDCRRRYAEAGDKPRLRLTEIHPKGYAVRETDPERALALFEEGRRQAQALAEPWWVFFFDHWIATARLHFLRDFRDVLDHVVRMALEARKPTMERHPLRYAAFDDLIAAYVGIDPLGYAGPITEALTYLQNELPQEACTERYLLHARWQQFAVARDDLDAALEQGRLALALADGDPDGHRARHFSVFVHDDRCNVHYRRGDWEALGRDAAAGEDLARIVGHQLELSELLLWRALAAWHQGDREEARRLQRTARTRLTRLLMPLHAHGFDALCAWYELENDPRTVLAVRQGELRQITDKGRLAYETSVRIKLCRLLRRLNEPCLNELAEARAAAAKLRDPAPSLAQLERIERGE